MSGLPSWARKGVKVVCVKREAWRPQAHFERAPCVPVYGATYTVRQVVPFGIDFSLALDEVAGPYCFAVSNFRPLVSSKTEAEDVALFRKHLTQKSPEHEPA